MLNRIAHRLESETLSIDLRISVLFVFALRRAFERTTPRAKKKNRKGKHPYLVSRLRGAVFRTPVQSRSCRGPARCFSAEVAPVTRYRDSDRKTIVTISWRPTRLCPIESSPSLACVEAQPVLALLLYGYITYRSRSPLVCLRAIALEGSSTVRE